MGSTGLSRGGRAGIDTVQTYSICGIWPATQNGQTPLNKPRREMLQLFGKSTSINVRKVLWTCHEIGIEMDQREFGSGFESTGTPEFLAMNLNAMVPVIKDGDFVLWESNSICRY